MPDIVTVSMIEAKPHGHQTENHQIDPNFYWMKRGRATWAQIVAATDDVNGPLWVDGDSSYHGTNDKVSEERANLLTNSLLLIQPANLKLVVAKESQYMGGSRRRVRASFDYKDVHYNFVITDPWIESKYFSGDDGQFEIKKSRLCISLAEVANGIATKLVATVLTPDRCGGTDD